MLSYFTNTQPSIILTYNNDSLESRFNFAELQVYLSYLFNTAVLKNMAKFIVENL